MQYLVSGEIYEFNYDCDGTFIIRLINKEWESSTATWNNLSSAYDDEVIASANYVRRTKKWFTFDVTEAVKKMVAGTITNNGFMVFIEHDDDLSNGSGGHTSTILSSECPVDTLRQKLTVDYGSTPIIQDLEKGGSNLMSIASLQNGNITISIKNSGTYSVTLYSAKGRVVRNMGKMYLASGSHCLPFDTGVLPRGVYFIEVTDSYRPVIAKMITN